MGAIEEAAYGQADQIDFSWREDHYITFVDGFKAGAEWALAQVTAHEDEIKEKLISEIADEALAIVSAGLRRD